MDLMNCIDQALNPGMGKALSKETKRMGLSGMAVSPPEGDSDAAEGNLPGISGNAGKL